MDQLSGDTHMPKNLNCCQKHKTLDNEPSIWNMSV
jgi:hypothetical protein